MMYYCNTGPPGGKAKLGGIIGDIYFNLGIIKGNKEKKKIKTKIIF